MQRRLLLALLLLPAPALAQSRRRARRPPPPPRPAMPELDPPPRAGLAPMPNRRFPTPEQVVTPRTELLPGIPGGRAPTRGSSYLERDLNPEAIGRRESPRPEPGISVRIPFR